MLEYEKSIIMREKLYKIAEIVQKFASKNITDKYVKTLERMYISSKEVEESKSLYLNMPKMNT